LLYFDDAGLSYGISAYRSAGDLGIDPDNIRAVIAAADLQRLFRLRIAGAPTKAPPEIRRRAVESLAAGTFG
jgi:hypothetical protein